MPSETESSWADPAEGLRKPRKAGQTVFSVPDREPSPSRRSRRPGDGGESSSRIKEKEKAAHASSDRCHNNQELALSNFWGAGPFACRVTTGLQPGPGSRAPLPEEEREAFCHA